MYLAVSKNWILTIFMKDWKLLS